MLFFFVTQSVSDCQRDRNDEEKVLRHIGCATVLNVAEYEMTCDTYLGKSYKVLMQTGNLLIQTYQRR